MTRWFRSITLVTLLASASLLAGAAGCGNSPTSPVSTDGAAYAPGGGPEVLRIAADGSATWVAIPAALQSGTLIPGYDDAAFDPRRQLTVSQRIDGAVGGRLVCGRYVASVPPGAFLGVGVITMTLPDSTLMLCDLEVSPAELNAFLLPIDLSLHTTGTTTDLDSLEIYWWDPSESRWTGMGCEKTYSLEPVLADELLTAEPVQGALLRLSHFSRYAAGKAGW
ncbi:MAG TPA: hypothetical protein VI198_06780 [Candidatus Eisenbacteria bacterium]